MDVWYSAFKGLVVHYVNSFLIDIFVKGCGHLDKTKGSFLTSKIQIPVITFEISNKREFKKLRLVLNDMDSL